MPSINEDDYLGPGHAALSAGDLPPPLNNAEKDRADQAANAFFQRNGFDASTRKSCDDFAKTTYSLAKAEPSPQQGYCSYTLRLPGEHLLQFRPKNFALDMQVCDQARKMFPTLVPLTVFVGNIRVPRPMGVGDSSLEVVLQREMPGVTLADFRRAKESLSVKEMQACRHCLVEDMAGFFATSYLHRRYPGIPGHDFPRGNVGSSLRKRLDILEGLPESQTKAKRALAAIERRIDFIESETPWCLTHGDLVPENVMVDPRTGRLTGLIDWAEGEWLPFGVGLYGLEELLGETDTESGFQFFPEQQDLRASFWRRFLKITQPTQAVFSNRWLNDLRTCRQLGILLWRGIAFDDGRLDRVVDAEKDSGEIQKLTLFLEAPHPLEGAGWIWRAESLFLCAGRYLGCSSGASGEERPRLTRPKDEASSPSIKARESWREAV